MSYGTTMDNELLHELFSSVIRASEILGEDAGYAAHLKEVLGKMAPMQIGKWGQLQEWIKDWDDPQDNHRHVSHLYALYPGNQITPEDTGTLRCCPYFADTSWRPEYRLVDGMEGLSLGSPSGW